MNAKRRERILEKIASRKPPIPAPPPPVFADCLQAEIQSLGGNPRPGESYGAFLRASARHKKETLRWQGRRATTAALLASYVEMLKGGA